MPSKERQGGTSNSQQTCMMSYKPGVNYSPSWPTGPLTSASYNIFPPHGSKLPMHRGQEWEGYAETQRYNTFFGVFFFSQSTQARLVSSSNPKEDVTMNGLELGALLMQILFFAPRMAP